MWKKIISMVLVICMLTSVVPQMALAEETSPEVSTPENTETINEENSLITVDEKWEYELYGEGVVLTKYLGTDTDVFVPGNIETEEGQSYNVLKLGDSIFENNDGLNSATLGSGILEIGAKAFYDADQMVCILISEELTTIGDEAFYSCDNFNSIIIYDAVTNIGEHAFGECPKLVIWCNENSYAHLYAKEKELKYYLLNPDSELETYIQDGVSFHIQNGEAIAYDFDGTLTKVVIPTTIEGYPVTELHETFKDCTELISVCLPNGVKTISDYAFYNCTSLSNIALPDSVRSIGAYAFYNCLGLLNITIPKSVTTVDDYTFYNCSLLKEIVLSENITSIGSYAFYKCENLKEFSIPQGVSVIQNCTFSNCTSLTSVTIPESVTTLGGQAFAQCKSLKLITIPDSVISVERGIFWGCTSLEKVHLSDNLEVISYEMFKDCTSLIEISIPDSITNISNGAFENCTSLTQVVIPDNVITLNSSVFKGCTSLVDVSISTNVTCLNDNLFEGCTSLKEFTVSSNITRINEYAFKDCINLKEVSLEGTKYISSYAFQNCSSLETINLPDGLLTIQDNAFAWCRSLQDVIIPDSVTSVVANSFPEDTVWLVYEDSYSHDYAVENQLFYFVYDRTEELKYCTQDGVTYCYMNDEATVIDCNETLTEVVIPNVLNGCTVNRIRNAFKDCTALESITLPNNLEFIEQYSFYNCVNLREINIPTSVTFIGDSAFYNCDSLTEIIIPNEITSISSNLFNDCDNLAEVTLPNNLTEINARAFSGCSTLQKINFSSNLKIIGDFAFSGCSSLNSVAIPETVNSIGVTSFSSNTLLIVYADSYAHTFAEKYGLFYIPIDGEEPSDYRVIDGVIYCLKQEYAIAVGCDKTLTKATVVEEIEGLPVTELQKTFYNCSVLVSVSLPESLEMIGNTSFRGCSKLKSVTLPEKVSSIGNGAFFFCRALKTINIPESVTTIGSSAFYDCDALQSITIPENVTTIENNTFYSCSGLKKIILSSNLSSIGERAFIHSGLESITIPKSVTIIGYEAFASCTALKTVVLEGDLLNVGKNLFTSCTALTNVSVLGSLPEIGFGMFDYCSELTSINIPDGVTTISNYAFRRCTKLKTVTIPNSVTNIYAQAFADCRSLTSITIPGSVDVIGSNAFGNCTALTEVVIENGVNEIFESAFLGCINLTSVILPNTLKKIGASAFYNCTNLTAIILPNSLTSTGNSTFGNCNNLSKVIIGDGITIIERECFKGCTSLTQIEIPESVQTIGEAAFMNCTGLLCISLPEGILTIEKNAFSNCTGIKNVIIPENVTSVKTTSFSSKTILLVYQSSYAHTYAKENNLLYYVISRVDNPEIAYGTNLSGVVSYAEGTVAPGAAVELIYDDGILSQTYNTTSDGTYNFTYAEVGKYTIRATDNNGCTATESVYVKRMNVFDVFVSGDTNLVLKNGWEISGTVSDNNANITLTDSEGNVLGSITTSDGSFAFENVPNGSYIIKAESENGSVSKEITVFDGSVSDIILEIPTETATVWGYVEVEDRAGKHHRRNWVQVSIYNEDGNIVAQKRSDIDGKYEFTKLPLGEYTIVAETTELRPDKKLGYDRNHTLTGYAYVNAEEISTYQVDTIILYEENDSITTVSGKVTANGETQDCEVTIRNVFRYEVAKQTTGKNGKYAFKNIRDGLYFITAITKSDGMGFAVIVVRNGRIYGETSIKVLKSSKVKALEAAFYKDVPECDSREEVIEYRERIAQEKRNYDALSKKEKKQLSQEYIVRLNKYCEWLSNCEYTASEGVSIEGAGLVVSGGELENEDTVVFNLSVTEKKEHVLNGVGINSAEDYIQHSMEDAAQKQHDYGILKYYEISMTKQVGDGEAQTITSVYKNTEATGKFRITIEIPEEYRGYKHYSFIHVHNGEVITLVDLDDNPNTVTFEVDAFSTFALLGTDEEQTGQFVVGDLDNDSDFTNLDIAIMRTFLTKKIKSFDFATSDVNCDNEVDIRDVIALKRGIVEGTLKNGEEGSEGGEVESPEEEW